jgi:hypothetical protein
MHFLQNITVIHGLLRRLQRHNRQESIFGAKDTINMRKYLIEVREYIAVGGQHTMCVRKGHKARIFF